MSEVRLGESSRSLRSQKHSKFVITWRAVGYELLARTLDMMLFLAPAMPILSTCYLENKGCFEFRFLSVLTHPLNHSDNVLQLGLYYSDTLFIPGWKDDYLIN